jgi:pilus assembly protein CpaF
MTGQNPNGGYQLTEQDLARIRDFYLSSVLKRIDQMDRDADPEPEEIHSILEEIHQQENISIEGRLKESLFREVLFEIIGFGPIQPALNDQEVTEVMVNGPHQVYLEKSGKLSKSNIQFKDDDHIIRIIEKIVYPLGRRIDHDSPMVDARLPDGSRVNAVIPPVAIDGPSITIRKFSKEKLTVENLIAFGSITPTAAEFLKACVEARLNIIISGGTGSGKTTLLNILSGFIPRSDRIVTIEDSAELQLQQDHVVRLETQPPSLDNKGEITIRDLVRNSLRMRPDRIVVGEVRGGETIDMLQAMNTGHDGSLTTLHANTPRDALSRLETMAMMSGMDLPIRVIREQIASAVDLIVQQSRFTDGSRKVTHITEVAGMEGDTIVMTDVFKFKQAGVEDERILGTIQATGIRPQFSEHLQAAGFEMTAEMFGIGQS